MIFIPIGIAPLSTSLYELSSILAVRDSPCLHVENSPFSPAFLCDVAAYPPIFSYPVCRRSSWVCTTSCVYPEGAVYLELRAPNGRNNSRSNSGSNNRSMQGSLTFPALTMQIAREGAEASWCALQPGNQSQSLIALEVAVQQEEHRQSRLGGLAGERVIKEMNDGGIAPLIIAIEHIKGLLELVLLHTHTLVSLVLSPSLSLSPPLLYSPFTGSAQISARAVYRWCASRLLLRVRGMQSRRHHY